MSSLTARIPPKAKGILYILSAAFFFSLMTFFVKLSGDVPSMQKVFFRMEGTSPESFTKNVIRLKKNAADRMYRMPFALGGMRAVRLLMGTLLSPELKLLLF